MNILSLIGVFLTVYGTTSELINPPTTSVPSFGRQRRHINVPVGSPQIITWRDRTNEENKAQQSGLSELQREILERIRIMLRKSKHYRYFKDQDQPMDPIDTLDEYPLTPSETKNQRQLFDILFKIFDETLVKPVRQMGILVGRVVDGLAG